MKGELDYWLTTPRLRLTNERFLQFAEAELRIISEEYAGPIRETMTKRLMGPARRSDVYAPKVDLFCETTSLALRLPGTKPDHGSVRKIGSAYEQLIFLSEAFALKRSKLQRSLGIGEWQQPPCTDLILPVVDRRWHYSDRFSTRTLSPPLNTSGLAVGRRTRKRFAELGLDQLAVELVRPSKNSTLRRVQQALSWLNQSLLESDASAAAVKTCIGFESLFGFDKNEPLRQSISDRCAFLLARSAGDRPALAKSIRDFYDHRSSIVHGGSKKRSSWTEDDQQRMDRLLLIAALQLAGMSKDHPNVDALRQFFDELKWSTQPAIPEGLVRSSVVARSYKELLEKTAR